MSTPEGKVKDRIKKLLAKYNCYWFMPVQTGFGAPGLDFHAVANGLAFFVETKAGNKRPTPRQESTIDTIQKAGGRCFVVNEVTGLDLLETWLQEITA